MKIESKKSSGAMYSAVPANELTSTSDDGAATLALTGAELHELETLRRWLRAATGPAINFAVRKMVESATRREKHEEARRWQARIAELRGHVQRMPGAANDKAALEASRAARAFITEWWPGTRRPSGGLTALSEALRLFARPGGAKRKAAPSPGSEGNVP